MRIIGGCFKGKKLLQPNDFKTRPLKDLTKESIFNIINHTKKFNINLSSSVVLDVFSGVGSFGIECISRGAKNVVFIENYKNNLNIKYICASPESLKIKKKFDVVLNMEVVEHVNDLDFFINKVQSEHSFNSEIKSKYLNLRTGITWEKL